MEASHRFFANRACAYYPCHEMEGELNCLFCYCPLYMRKHCPGSPEWILGRDGRKIKSCVKCTFPHQPKNYEVMMQFLRMGGREEREVKVAVMADIHNNHTAFEACVDHALAQGIEKFIFLGDYVSDCPYPQRTMELLYLLIGHYDCTCIRGNREEYVLDYHRSQKKNWKDGSGSGSLLYNYENLTVRDLNFFASLPIRAECTYGNCPKLLVCHGSPDSAGELLFEGEENTKRVMRDMDADYLLCAHTHVQSEWEYRGKHLINPGAVGMPMYYEGKAQYAVLTGDGTGWRCRLLRVPFDKEQVLREFEESGLNRRAPVWARMTQEMIRTGVNRMSQVHDRAKEICEGTYEWPDFPEAAWEQALDELWPDAGKGIGRGGAYDHMRKGTIGKGRG